MLLLLNMPELFQMPSHRFSRLQRCAIAVGGVDGLADALRIPSETVRSEFATYVKHAAPAHNTDGRKDEFGKVSFPDDFSGYDSEYTTLYYAEVTPAIHYTMGGVATNAGQYAADCARVVPMKMLLFTPC